MVLVYADFEYAWKNLLHIDNLPWLYDHKVNEGMVLAFAAYVFMADEATRRVSGIQDGVGLRHVSINTALLVNKVTLTELVTTLRRHYSTDTPNCVAYIHIAA
ncbi:hypothetical protein LZ31DRAFT_600977 [Colletotrichum somersetense]|nr:hypothetical protein LZ31DRAFT_600977 [Colletotrichum somersetense]